MEGIKWGRLLAILFALETPKLEGVRFSESVGRTLVERLSQTWCESSVFFLPFPLSDKKIPPFRHSNSNQAWKTTPFSFCSFPCEYTHEPFHSENLRHVGKIFSETGNVPPSLIRVSNSSQNLFLSDIWYSPRGKREGCRKGGKQFWREIQTFFLSNNHPKIWCEWSGKDSIRI